MEKFYKLLKGKIKIIGVGGVDSGTSAYEKFLAGASYIQLYTGMVYKGPGVVKEMKKELIAILKKEKLIIQHFWGEGSQIDLVLKKLKR